MSYEGRIAKGGPRRQKLISSAQENAGITAALHFIFPQRLFTKPPALNPARVDCRNAPHSGSQARDRQDRLQLTQAFIGKLRRKLEIRLDRGNPPYTTQPTYPQIPIHPPN